MWWWSKWMRNMFFADMANHIYVIYICTVSCCIIYFRVSETFCLLWARVCARSRAMHSTYDGNTYCHIVLLSISRQKQPWRRCGTYDNNVHRIFTPFTNWMTCYGGAYRSSLYSNNKQYNAIWINGRATRAARVCSFLNDMIYIYIYRYIGGVIRFVVARTQFDAKKRIHE